MTQIGYRARLAERQVAANTLLCVGLDPLVEKLPMHFQKLRPTSTVVYLWMKGIVDATAPFASMFKFQRAHWEAIPGGISAMQELITYIRLVYPTIPIFLDCKRGDIDRTQRQYREAHFTLDGVDGMNYNGYMGVEDALKPLVDPEHLERALVGLGRTSNSKAWRFQDRMGRDGKTNWEFTLKDILAYSEKFGVLENAGVVMGAAHPHPEHDPEYPFRVYSEHLERAREIVGDKLWFLILGAGRQGGVVDETVRVAYRGPGSIAINVSSDIDFAGSGMDFAEASARVAEKYRDEMNAAIPKPDGPPCSTCGSIMIPSGSLWKCKNCGATTERKLEAANAAI